MARLAIKGHKERGAEVITLLEMLGCINKHNYSADCDSLYFYGGPSTSIIYYDWVNVKTCYKEEDTLIFTLEEFEEKFPYKVGDKVIYEGKGREITKMVWEESTNTVAYKLDDKLYCNVIDELQPYKEETMEEKLMPKIDFNDYCKDKYLLDLGNYEIKEENGKTYVVRKQPQYPKTYEECCEVLGIDVSRNIKHEYYPFYKDVTCYESNLLSSLAALRKLLICRDAYWKIGGIPDVKSSACCCLYYDIDEDDVLKELGPFDINSILIFPTQEICDIFYDAFEELIKKCKSWI